MLAKQQNFLFARPNNRQGDEYFAGSIAVLIQCHRGEVLKVTWNDDLKVGAR